MQDATITVRNNKGLCFYTDSSECQYCDNETFSLEGLNDHIIHLSPQKPYSNCGNYSAGTSENIILTYLNYNFLLLIARLALIFVFFLGWIRWRKTK